MDKWIIILVIALGMTWGETRENYSKYHDGQTKKYRGRHIIIIQEFTYSGSTLGGNNHWIHDPDCPCTKAPQGEKK